MKIFNTVILLSIMFMAGILYSEVPNEVIYTGRLREFGASVNGRRTMKFDIYATATGGASSWSTGNIDVMVSTGVFSCRLTPDIDWRKKDYWIETVIAGRILVPREKITAQIYALHSRTAEDIGKLSGQSINFKIGDNNYMSISEGRIQIVSGALYFPDGSMMTSANIGSAASVSTSQDAVIQSELGKIQFKVANEEKMEIKRSGEVKSYINGAAYYMVPKGAIIMWSGTIDKIPAGWGLCDGKWYNPDDLTVGQAGHDGPPDASHLIKTPDLKGRFIAGYDSADADYNATGKIGGVKIHALTAEELPSHNDTVNIPAHSHTASCSGVSDHIHSIFTSGHGGGKPGMVWSADSTETGNMTQAGGSHNHSITIDGGGSISAVGIFAGSSKPIENRPPYYTIAYIMKL